MVNRTTRNRSILRGLLPAALAAALAGLCHSAAAQNVGMLITGRDRVAIFDADSGDVISDVFVPSSTSGGLGDCDITPDGSLGFVSDPLLRGVWVFDLTASPPGLASGTDFVELPGAIPIDLAVTHDGRFLVTGSNFNLFLPVTVIDIASRTEVDRVGVVHTQSVAACDDGSIVGTSSRGLTRRFEIDDNGQISLVNQTSIPQFYIKSVCAPGSATAVLGRTNTSFIPNGQFRSVALPGMTSVQTVVTGGSVVDVLFNRSGDRLYVRKNQRLMGFNYDPATGAIDEVPFFDVGGMPFVANVGPGEAMAIHPDGSRLFIPIGGRIDVFSTTDGSLLGSIDDPAIVGGGAICTTPELADPVLLIADAGGPYTVNEGATVLLSAADSIGPIVIVEWDFDYDGTEFNVDATGATPTFDATAMDGPATLTIAVRVGDGLGNEDTSTALLEVLNVAPVADAGGPYVVDEGGTITLDGSAVDAPADQDSLLFEWDLDGDGDFDDATGPTPVLDAALFDGPELLTVSLRVSDDDGTAGGSPGTDGDTATVQVDNVAPTVGEIAGLPSDPEAITEMLSVSADFFDPGPGEEYTATWNWGDGTTSPGAVTSNDDGTGSITGEHVYAEPGVYVVTVDIGDGDGGAASVADEDFIVIYDPDGGFVTGGGWIDSPAGAYAPDPTLAGSANFGFVAKYKKGATTPDGSTEFQFQAGSLNFHSNTYEWLVVAGARAQFKGEGTVNGTPGYGFMITAIDGRLPGGNGMDRFRIKIWEIAGGAPIYDNQLGADDGDDPTTLLTGGSIVIHKKGGGG